MESNSSNKKDPIKFHGSAELFPMMGDAAIRALAQDIKANGLTTKILVRDGEVVDGRARLKGCRIAGVEPTFAELPAAMDPFAAAISLNLHRRHLSDDQRAAVAARVREGWVVESKRTKASLAACSRHGRPCPVTPSGTKLRTHERAGMMMGVPAKRVLKAADLLKGCRSLFDEVLAGGKTICCASAQMRRERRHDEMARASASLPQNLRDAAGRIWEYRHCEMADLLSSEKIRGKVDLILTDPDWGKVDDYGLLARLAKKALSQEGLLAVMVGQSALESVVAAMRGPLPYRWTVSWLSDGGSRTLVTGSRQVSSSWKPVLVYSKGGDWQRFLTTDVVRSPREEKDLDAWQMSLPAAIQLVRLLSPAGALVVDPFAGTGTVGIACIAAGENRRFVGCDIDLAKVGTATLRRDEEVARIHGQASLDDLAIQEAA